MTWSTRTWTATTSWSTGRRTPSRPPRAPAIRCSWRRCCSARSAPSPIAPSSPAATASRSFRSPSSSPTSRRLRPDALLAEANEVLANAGHPRIAVLDVALTPQDFPVGVTGKVLKRELRERYGDLALCSSPVEPCRRRVHDRPARQRSGVIMRELAVDPGARARRTSPPGRGHRDLQHRHRHVHDVVGPVLH